MFLRQCVLQLFIRGSSEVFSLSCPQGNWIKNVSFTGFALFFSSLFAFLLLLPGIATKQTAYYHPCPPKKVLLSSNNKVNTFSWLKNASFCYQLPFRISQGCAGECVFSACLGTEILVSSLLFYWAGGEVSLNDSILQLV